MATDGLIQQRLGEAPEDEAVKERLEREHGELLEEVRALIRSAQDLVASCSASASPGRSAT